MDINLNGIVADKDRIKYSVKGNNNCDIIIFKVEKQQENIALSTRNHFYVKVQNKLKTFADKSPVTNVTEQGEYIFVTWVMLQKVTRYKNIDIQLQYESTEGEIVWQSSIVNIDMHASIEADKEIENVYPSILTHLQKQIDDLHQDILPTVGGKGIVVTHESERNVISVDEDVVVTKKNYLSLERLGDYIYKISFDKIPEYRPINDAVTGACTSFVREGKLYRNLDWAYSRVAEFMVYTNKFKGVAFIDGLNDSELTDDKLDQLPYRVVDGINNYGIMVSTHVLYNDFEYDGSGDKSVSLASMVYHILSNAKSIETLERDIRPYINNVYVPDVLKDLGYVSQFLVTDGITTIAILPPLSGESWEFVDITSNPKLTNFRWVNKPTLQLNDSELQVRPNGIERWNLIDDKVELEDLKYTLAYTSPDRLSEFVGINYTTKYSSEADLMPIYEAAHRKYINRSRNGETWHTMHAVIYSAKGLEHLYIQENFKMDYASGAASDVQWGKIKGNIEDQEDLKERITDINQSISQEETTRAEEDERLQALIEAIDIAWGKIGGNIDDQLDLKIKLDIILSIAQGNTKAYTVDTDIEGNEIFKSDELDIQVEQFIDISGNTIKTSDLNNGDLIFTKNKKDGETIVVYRDRWLTDKDNNSWSILVADDPRLENYAELAGNNTFTGTNTFSGKIIASAISSSSNTFSFTTNNNANLFTVTPWDFRSTTSKDLGTSSYLWKDLFLAGAIKDGTNSVTVSQIANGLFDVINGSDIASTGVLTDEQYAMFTNGKPTSIKGYTNWGTNIELSSLLYTTGGYNVFLGTCGSGNDIITIPFVINASTKTFNKRTDRFLPNIYIGKIKGKAFPDYPTDYTKPYVQVLQPNEEGTNNEFAYVGTDEIGTPVEAKQFDPYKNYLQGIKIGDTTYALPLFTKAEYNPDRYGIGIGYGSYARGSAISIGRNSSHNTGGQQYISIGSWCDNGINTTNIGHCNQNHVVDSVSFDEEYSNHGSGLVNKKSYKTIILNDVSKIFFRNEDTNPSYTDRSQYTNGKTLQDLLAEKGVEIIRL